MMAKRAAELRELAMTAKEGREAALRAAKGLWGSNCGVRQFEKVFSKSFELSLDRLRAELLAAYGS